MTPDGRTLLTVEADTGHLWDATTGIERFARSVGCNTGRAFIAGGTLAVVWSRGGPSDCRPRVLVWDVAAKAIRSTIDLPDRRADPIGFSDNGKVMFQVGERSSRAGVGTAVWDADTGEQRFADLPGRDASSRRREPGRQPRRHRDRTRLSVWAVGGTF